MSHLNPFRQKTKLDTIFSVAILCAIAWYATNCFGHYMAQRPLWNDESCVFQSVEAFSAKEMFSQPLQALQVFPRTYLFVIQSFAKQFDYHLLALRFFPFVFMMGSFVMWLKIAAKEFDTKWEYLTFILTLSASAVMTYYSAELKQYSMDVFTASVFIWYLYNQENSVKAKNKGEGTSPLLYVLPFFAFFSYITYFFLIFPLYNLFLHNRRGQCKFKPLIIYSCICAVVVILSYTFDMRLKPTDVLLREWRDYFIQFDTVGEFFKTLGEGTNNLFSRWLVERPKILKKISLTFMSFGFIYMIAAYYINIKKDGYILKSLHTLAFVIWMGFKWDIQYSLDFYLRNIAENWKFVL